MDNSQIPLSAQIASALSNPKARGLRLKIARFMTGLSHRQIEELSGIPANTLKAWETNTYEVLEEDATKITLALQRAGVFCTSSWLLFGAGDPPHIDSMSPAV